MEDKRVVITGAGPVSAVGIGRAAFQEALKRRQTGIGPITAFPTEGLVAKSAAEVRGFDVRDYLETEKTYLDRASQFAFAAMSLAIEDADLDLKKMDRASLGLILGSAVGCLGSAQLFFGDYLEKGPRFVKPILFPHTYANTTISLLAIEYGLDGYHLDFASGGISSAQAILQGYDLIRTGRCPLVFVGGVEALSPLRLWGGELSAGPEPENGCIPGEGAGILVLEEADYARQRGARLLGELFGGGMAGDSMTRAMRRAAGRLPDGGSGILAVSSASAGATLDAIEAEAIRECLGPRAGDVPVSCPKRLLGETLGADAALRTIAALDGSTGVTLVNCMDRGGDAVCLAIGPAGVGLGTQASAPTPDT